MERLTESDADRAAEWLEVACPHGSVTGYDVGGWPASIWLPHAMYEVADIPNGLTHDDVERIERSVRVEFEPERERTPVESVLDELIEGSTNIGSPLGVSSAPGGNWRRLFWSELAERLEVDAWALDVPPCHRSFPFESWPANIRPPAEGSLDREQLARVVEHLAALSPKGEDTVCYALLASLPTREVGRSKIVHAGELREVLALYDRSDFGPANIWPEDRAWLTYSDQDLWATRVDGSHDLISRIQSDPEIEGVELPFDGESPDDLKDL
jgi:hypothetical protein